MLSCKYLFVWLPQPQIIQSSSSFLKTFLHHDNLFLWTTFTTSSIANRYLNSTQDRSNKYDLVIFSPVHTCVKHTDLLVCVAMSIFALVCDARYIAASASVSVLPVPNAPNTASGGM